MNDLHFQFASGQIANRFLNELLHWTSTSGQIQVKAKLLRSDCSVKVSYLFDGKGFDYTSSELDDLAAKYGGCEI